VTLNFQTNATTQSDLGVNGFTCASGTSASPGRWRLAFRRGSTLHLSGETGDEPESCRQAPATALPPRAVREDGLSWLTTQTAVQVPGVACLTSHCRNLRGQKWAVGFCQPDYKSPISVARAVGSGGAQSSRRSPSGGARSQLVGIEKLAAKLVCYLRLSATSWSWLHTCQDLRPWPACGGGSCHAAEDLHVTPRLCGVLSHCTTVTHLYNSTASQPRVAKFTWPAAAVGMLCILH
jgi:hypothetical protein